MSYTILVVDDSKLARMAVNKALNALHPDWQRLEAGSSDEALECIEHSRPDIVLLDFNMPGRNGLELAAELRSRHPDLPVALISANRQQEIVTRTAAVGAFFLPKPLTQHALATFLEAAVQGLGKQGS